MDSKSPCKHGTYGPLLQHQRKAWCVTRTSKGEEEKIWPTTCKHVRMQMRSHLKVGEANCATCICKFFSKNSFKTAICKNLDLRNVSAIRYITADGGKVWHFVLFLLAGCMTWTVCCLQRKATEFLTIAALEHDGIVNYVHTKMANRKVPVMCVLGHSSRVIAWTQTRKGTSTKQTIH